MINLDNIKSKSACHNALCIMLEKMAANGGGENLTTEDAEKGIENVIKTMKDEACKTATNHIGVITPDRAEDILAEEFKIEIPSGDDAEGDAEKIVDITDLL